MRVLDDKGRLFGVVNIIDLVLVIALIAVAMAGVSLVTNRAPTTVVARADKNIAYDMVVRQIRPEQVGYLRVGDVVKRHLTQGIVGTIAHTEVSVAESIGIDSEGRQKISLSPRDKDVFLTIEATGRAGKDIIAVGNEVIKVGDKFDIDTRMFTGEAIILGMEVAE